MDRCYRWRGVDLGYAETAMIFLEQLAEGLKADTPVATEAYTLLHPGPDSRLSYCFKNVAVGTDSRAKIIRCHGCPRSVVRKYLILTILNNTCQLSPKLLFNWPCFLIDNTL
jgi:hypothetical protein